MPVHLLAECAADQRADERAEVKKVAKVLLERRTPNEANCPTEIFVTRAMCQ